MPQLGETVTEGTITRWCKAEGDRVTLDEPLFEVSTDKVDTDVPSAFAGYLRRILVPEGGTVPIHTVLALITATTDEPIEEPDAQNAPVDDLAGPTQSQGQHRRGPGRRSTGTGHDSHRGPEGFLSPVVRRLIDEHGLDATRLVGSGRDGRITRADVLAAAANRGAGPHRASLSIPAPEPAPGDVVVPFTKARAATAEHMVRSRATSAHALLTVEVDYHAVDQVRRAAGLSYLPFVARAVIDAMETYPNINATVADNALIVHAGINIGIAVDQNGEALLVPVVRDAAGLRLRALGTMIEDLAARVRSQRLNLDELTGATFTITNVGGYGTASSAPIINQPQVAILSIDGIAARPVARLLEPSGGSGAAVAGPSDWMVTVHPVGNLSLAFDHRAFDGAYAAGFIALVRDILQTREWDSELR